MNVKANSGEIWVPENGEWTEDLPQGASDKEPGETAAQSPEQPGAGETAQDAGQKVSGGEAVKESSAANEAQQNSAGTERAVWEAGGKASGKEGVLGETAQKSSGAGENTRDGACGGKAEATEPSGAAESALAGAAGQETAHGPADGKAAAEEALKKVFEEGKIAGLQEAILAIMEKNGPITDQMRRDVRENVYHDSLIAWVKSFR